MMMNFSQKVKKTSANYGVTPEVVQPAAAAAECRELGATLCVQQAPALNAAVCQICWS
jgi:hypothetical protein